MTISRRVGDLQPSNVVLSRREPAAILPIRRRRSIAATYRSCSPVRITQSKPCAFSGSAPGAVVRAHRDCGRCFEEGAVCLYLPVYTNSNMEFALDSEPLKLAAGECWYVNFALDHDFPIAAKAIACTGWTMHVSIAESSNGSGARAKVSAARVARRSLRSAWPGSTYKNGFQARRQR